MIVWGDESYAPACVRTLANLDYGYDGSKKPLHYFRLTAGVWASRRRVARNCE
jgi:hypothetical protein